MSGVDGETSKESGPAGESVPAESVSSHLEKIVSSSVFAPSQRLVRFLRYVTERSLEGQAGELKEYAIGLEVFDRDTSYDPRIDTIVRSEARRLRSKLKQYYDTDGRFDAIAIDLPKGAYAPIFRKRDLAVEGERAGAVIRRYHVGERIGSGATSVVYKAKDTRLQRTVALKFLAPQLVSDQATKARLIREAQAAAALDHPNICTVFEIDEADGQTFTALGYVDGESLDSRIANGPLEIKDAIEIARQIGSALAEAHRKGVVHRDLKPSNVMLERGGLAKVVDFGLAQVAGRSRLTREGITVGTAAYLAPEQIQRQESDERSDIWSLGVVLYEMITGRSPFEGERDEATLYAILHEEPAPISQLRPDVPPALQRVVTRALQKWPAQRYQHATEFLKDLAASTGGVAAEVPGEQPPTEPEPPKKSGLLPNPVSLSSAVVMALGAAVIAAVAAWMLRPDAHTTPALSYQMTQLTRDSGLTYQPSLSADGKLMAYASDRAAEGNLDIWVQQVPRGNPIRLTRNDADDHDPDFSPDGTTVVFRSERDGGGVYTVPALGGEERILADLGRRPRFSPDGNEMAYWTGESPFVFSVARIYIVRATGGEPRPFQPDFEWASHPVWSPDGRRILFSGAKDGVFDWWTAPAEGGAADSAGATSLVLPEGQNPIPLAWLDGPPRVLFSAYSGDTFDLWQGRISARTFRFTGAPERLTSGSEWHLYASGAAGKIAFSGVRENRDIWSFPLDAEDHRVTGEPSRLTTSAAGDFLPSLSADGGRLAFVSRRSGSNDIWLKDLATGEERALTATPFPESQPSISPSGSHVAYRAFENQTAVLFAVASEGGIPRKLCDGCFYPWSWASDSSRLLFGAQPNALSLEIVDLASGEIADVFRYPKPGGGFWSASLSPDSRWIVFHTDNSPLTRQTFIVPYRPGRPPKKEEWIAVTDGSSFDFEQRWAPGGNAIYILSERDGFRCVWAQPLDPATKQPTGEAIEVYHFGRAQLSPLQVQPTDVGLAVARDRFAITLSETTGNIWMLEPAEWP